jgi:hypothetical protein
MNRPPFKLYGHKILEPLLLKRVERRGYTRGSVFKKLTVMEKKSFKFYTSWNDAIKKMDEQQVRTFINNLCNYAEGKEVQLNGLMEEIMWSQVQPLLDYNEQMRQKKIENGRKGGIAKSEKKSEGNQELPKPTKSTKGNQDLPMKEDDDVEEDVEEEEDVDVEVDVESRKMIDDSRKMIVDKLIDVMKPVIEDGYISEEEVKEWKIADTREKLNYIFNDYPSWENDFWNLGLDAFIRKASFKSGIEINYIVHSTLKAHLLL